MNSRLGRKISVFSILKFTLPSITMMVIMSLYTVVDGMFVSQLIGTGAFSAVNIVYPLQSLTIGLGTMFGTGITAIVTVKLGEARQKEANQNFSFIIAFTILLGIVLSAVCMVFLKDILFLLGANSDIYQYCHDYAYPLVLFFTANILQLQFQSLYVADGKPHIGLILTMLGGVTNIVLDYIFIAGLHMGIAGAAIATGIGCSIPALYGILYFSLKKREGIYFVKPHFDKYVLLHTMTNGSSEMVSYLSTSITTFLFNVIMMRLVGQEGVAAIAILLYLDFILVSVCLGYSMGVAPLFSYNYGCKQTAKLRGLYRVSLIFCLTVGLIMTTAAFLFSGQLAQIFTKPDTEVFSLAVTGLSIYAFSYLFKGYNVFASAMFTSFENGRVSAVLSFMRTLVFLVLTLISLSYLFGVSGVWFATPIAELMALALAIAFTMKYGRKYHLFSEPKKFKE